MNATILDILNRLPEVNIRLENATHIADMTWFDFSTSTDQLKIVYIFRSKEEELLTAKNGRVLTGAWQFIENTHTLVLNQGNQHELYNALLVQGHYLILKRDGDNAPMLLINQAYYQRILEVAAKNVEKLIIRDLEKLIPIPSTPIEEAPIIDVFEVEEEIISESEPEVVEVPVPTPIVEEEETVTTATIIEETSEEEVPVQEEVEEIEDVVEQVIAETPEAVEVEEVEKEYEANIEEEEIIEETEEKIVEESSKPLSILEKLRQERGEEEGEKMVYPFGEKKKSLNDKLKEQLKKNKQETLLDKLSGKGKK